MLSKSGASVPRTSVIITANAMIASTVFVVLFIMMDEVIYLAVILL
ncbi:MAG: hypothetical protein AAB540_03625 [Patescibacteria group bacterium]